LERNEIDIEIIFCILDGPFDFLRRITMPPSAADVWFIPFAVGVPIFGTLFVYTTQGLWI